MAHASTFLKNIFVRTYKKPNSKQNDPYLIHFLKHVRSDYEIEMKIFCLWNKTGKHETIKVNNYLR